MRRLLAAAAVLTLALPMQASGQALSSQFGPTADVRLDNVGAGTVADWGRTNVGPYGGTLLTGDPTQPSISLYCVDFLNSVSAGNTWQVNVTGLGAGTDFGNTRLAGEGDALVRYRKAAYLASLFETYTSNYHSGIHAAIWTVMTPGFPNLGNVDDAALATSQAQPFLAKVNSADLGDFDFSEWRILSDVQGDGLEGGKQEFLTRVVSVPEPGTWMIAMTGFALIGLVGLRRRRDHLGGESV